MLTLPETITPEEMTRYNLLVQNVAPKKRTEEENQFVASMVERIQAPLRKKQAEHLAHIKELDAERHAEYEAKKARGELLPQNHLDSLDYVGLNIQGRPVEPEPELKPLTEDQQMLLDKLAESGASTAALSEMEKELRSRNS